MMIMPREEKLQYINKAKEDLPSDIEIGHKMKKKQALRYGENPAAFEDEGPATLYVDPLAAGPSIAHAQMLHGKKELSYNNIVDADNGLRLAIRLYQLFPENASAVIIKHKGPCGVGKSPSHMSFAQRLAFNCDPVNAFGGVNVYNNYVDGETAELIAQYFNEVVVAPGYTDDALKILKTRNNLRVLLTASFEDYVYDAGIDGTPILGGFVGQKRQVSHIDTRMNFEKVSSGRDPTSEELQAALFTWAVATRTPSNAIILGTQYETVGIGRGQGSRVDSTELAIKNAKEKRKINDFSGIVMASDAFFPFPDSVEAAGKAGIRVLAYPLGSDRDTESIEMGNKYDIVMLCTRPIPGEKKIERAFMH
jgi:AICAR transformylase/IMP cyclohydrolase PurH